MARCSRFVLCVAAALTTLACQSAPDSVAPAGEALAERRTRSELDLAHDGWLKLPLDLEAQKERDLRRSGCVLPNEATFRRWSELHALQRQCAEVVRLGPVALVGRAVDTFGEPLRHAEVEPKCEDAVHSFGTTSCVHVAWPLFATVRTDADGRFRLDFERLSPRQLESVQLVAHCLGAIPQRGAATVELGGVVGSAGGLLIDLGDVQLAAPAVAYVGRVLDVAGEPVAGARVALSRVGSDGVRSEVAHNWTDESGRAEFAALARAGSFSMSAHCFANPNARLIYVLTDCGPPMSAHVPVAPHGAETVVILEP